MPKASGNKPRRPLTAASSRTLTRQLNALLDRQAVLLTKLQAVTLSTSFNVVRELKLEHARNAKIIARLERRVNR